jgi:hypothetical protein
MVQVPIPVQAVGVRKNKKRVNMRSSSNCILHINSEQNPLNRLLSLFAHHVTSPTLSIVQNFISMGQGVTVWWGSKNSMLP